MANLFIYEQTMSEAQAESQHRALIWADSVFAYAYPEHAGIRRAISRSRWIYVGEQMDPHNWWNYHFYPASWGSVVFGRYPVSNGRILGPR